MMLFMAFTTSLCWSNNRTNQFKPQAFPGMIGSFWSNCKHRRRNKGPFWGDTLTSCSPMYTYTKKQHIDIKKIIKKWP